MASLSNISCPLGFLECVYHFLYLLRVIYCYFLLFLLLIHAIYRFPLYCLSFTCHLLLFDAIFSFVHLRFIALSVLLRFIAYPGDISSSFVTYQFHVPFVTFDCNLFVYPPEIYRSILRLNPCDLSPFFQMYQLHVPFITFDYNFFDYSFEMYHSVIQVISSSCDYY